jgi:hypothetical protein
MGRVFLAIQEIKKGIVRPTEALATPHERLAVDQIAKQRKKKKISSKAETKPPASGPGCWQRRRDITG